MKLYLILGISILGMHALGASYVRTSCNADPSYHVAWNYLADREKAIDSIVWQMYHRSGKTPQHKGDHWVGGFDNCVTEYPSEKGRPVQGLRRIVVDLQWYQKDKHGKSQLWHNGLLLEYYLWMNQGVLTRFLVNLDLCLTPSACKKKGIPFTPLSNPPKGMPVVPSKM